MMYHPCVSANLKQRSFSVGFALLVTIDRLVVWESLRSVIPHFSTARTEVRALDVLSPGRIIAWHYGCSPRC